MIAVLVELLVVVAEGERLELDALDVWLWASCTAELTA